MAAWDEMTEGGGAPADFAGARVLVVGAGGFIGRHVVAALAGRGARVTGTIRRGGSPPPAALMAAPHAAVEVDLLRPGALAEVVRTVAPAVAIDLASHGVAHAQRDEALARRLNDELAGELCDALADARDEGRLPDWRGARLVRAGSVAEYGEVAGDLDEATPARPTTLYGTTKLAGTRRLALRAAARALPAAVARLFMVYGAGEPLPRLLPTLLAATRTTAPIELTEGLQRRDFTWVGDVAEGLARLAAAPRVGCGEVVHLATGRLMEVRKFVEIAARELAIDPGRLRFGALPTPPDPQRFRSVSVARLDRLLGWLPKTVPQAGVRASLAAR